MRWAVRGTGLVSTVILARLLTPADFGLVAMATLVIGLLETFSNLGVDHLLMRTRALDRTQYDTAWTIKIIQYSVLAVVLFLTAPLAAAYFKEPRLIEAIRILALSTLLMGVPNIGVINFRKNLEFGRDFLFEFYSKIARVVFTVGFAIYLRNYWALVLGMIASSVFTIVLSYVMEPYRPRLSLADWRRFLKFSMWITPASIANFLNQRIDIFVVGYVANATQLGAYNVASELSRMGTMEIISPISRATFPNLAKLKTHPEEFGRAFAMIVRTVALVAFSLGFGICAVADDVVHIVLGNQWTFAVPLIEWLGAFGAFSAVTSVFYGNILILLDQEHMEFYLTWIRLVFFGSCIVIAGALGDLVDIAMTAAAASGFFMFVCIGFMPKEVPLSKSRMLMEALRPFAMGTVMFFVVKALHMDGVDIRFVTLGADVLVGAAVFVSLTFVTWALFGKSDGPELRLLGFLSARYRAFAGRPA